MEKHIAQVAPWLESWLDVRVFVLAWSHPRAIHLEQVQAQGLLQREVFAADRQGLEVPCSVTVQCDSNHQTLQVVLKGSTGRALDGFRELVSSHLVEPLLSCDEIISK